MDFDSAHLIFQLFNESRERLAVFRDLGVTLVDEVTYDLILTTAHHFGWTDEQVDIAHQMVYEGHSELHGININTIEDFVNTFSNNE